MYELIVRHFLACLSDDAIGSETIIQMQISGEKFSATGLIILEKNYLEVYFYEKWNGKEIHNYEIGDTFEPTEIIMSEGNTSPPNMLTEADLVALMEKHGIGTGNNNLIFYSYFHDYQNCINLINIGVG